MNRGKPFRKGQTSGFHANGEWDFHEAVAQNLEYREGLCEEKRKRVEVLLTERSEEFQRAGYWKRQAILKTIHLQVNREFSTAHCLF